MEIESSNLKINVESNMGDKPAKYHLNGDNIVGSSHLVIKGNLSGVCVEFYMTQRRKQNNKELITINQQACSQVGSFKKPTSILKQ